MILHPNFSFHSSWPNFIKNLVMNIKLTLSKPKKEAKETKHLFNFLFQLTGKRETIHLIARCIT